MFTMLVVGLTDQKFAFCTILLIALHFNFSLADIVSCHACALASILTGSDGLVAELSASSCSTQVQEKL